MIRIDEDFCFEQTGDNTFHLIRNTYPKYGASVTLQYLGSYVIPADKINFEFIESECEELNMAEDKYERDCFVEIMEGESAAHKILYAVEHGQLSQVISQDESGQEAYFNGLVITHERGKGLFAKAKI